MAAKSNAERQAKRRKKMKTRGYRRIQLPVSPNDHASFVDAAKSEEMPLYQWILEKLRKALSRE